DLRAEVASFWSSEYSGTVAPDQVAISSGCNQAFTAAMSTLAGPGDEVILPTPWYFNHKMWLDMAGIRTVPLPTDGNMVPTPEACAERMTPRTKAIVLVSPNNPTGAEYPAETLSDLLALARKHGVALLVDETYRDFHSTSPGTPIHPLFSDATWDNTLIALYSFSK
ncbi:MAG: aminotransferase class I/II-fold pyridoxal phosphate-dependent enzyme, partial [Pseudomonadota bacterium]